MFSKPLAVITSQAGLTHKMFLSSSAERLKGEASQGCDRNSCCHLPAPDNKANLGGLQRVERFPPHKYGPFPLILSRLSPPKRPEMLLTRTFKQELHHTLRISGPQKTTDLALSDCCTSLLCGIPLPRFAVHCFPDVVCPGAQLRP